MLYVENTQFSEIEIIYFQKFNKADVVDIHNEMNFFFKQLEF